MTVTEPPAPPHPADTLVSARPAAPMASTLSQGTAIEQSRAVAEVQAMVVVAQQRPRDQHAAIAAMRESCSLEIVASRAFYRFKRGDGMVSGSSIHLAVELARCWGNVTHGLTELRRDPVEGMSEMQAWAWDLQGNTRVAQVFLVPHLRDKKGGPQRLREVRDVYELTTNQGNRRVREAIKRVLPPWFVEEAEDLCRQTLEHGGGVPLARRVADAVKLFDGWGVKPAQLEAKLESPQDGWTPFDLAQLSIIAKSIQRGEVRVDDEFPRQRVTKGEIKAQAEQMSARPADAQQRLVDDAGNEYDPDDPARPFTEDGA